MNLSRAAAAAISVSVLAAAAQAQAADASRALQALRVPIHRAPAEALSPAPGLWAAGSDYKVAFRQGASFVPYLGAAAPENAEFRWRTVGFGPGVELRQPGVDPDRATAFRCEYDLGPLTEVYDVLPQGLEQSFVLGAEPEGDGDVAIRGAIGGNLRAAARAAEHGPIDFVDGAGRCVVRYGAAFAVDAGGVRTELATSFADGTLAIHVPRALLRSAEYPLLVDPLLSPVLIAAHSSGSVAGYSNLAIERDDRTANGNVMVAFARASSLLDTDVSAVLCDDDYGNPVTVFADLDSSIDSNEPDVAFVGGPGIWVLVLSRTTGGYTGCRYHLHPRGSLTLGSSLTAFNTPGTERETRPRVGGSRRETGGSTALLVRQRDPASVPGNTSSTSIVASVLDPVTFAQSATVLVDGGALVDAENVTVSKDADGGSWMIAWQSWRGLLANRWQVRARRIDAQGTLAAGVVTTDRAAWGMHEIAPRVDGRDGRWLLAFGELDETLFPGKITGNAFVRGRTMRFDWSETSASPDRTLASRALIGNVDRAFVFGGLSYDTSTRSHWAIGTSSIPYGTTYLQVVGFNGEPAYMHYLYTVVPNVNSSDWHAVCYDDDHARFLSVHATTSIAAGGNGHGYSVTGRSYEYPATSIAHIGVACSQAGITSTGRFQKGHEFANVMLTTAPPNSFALLCMSLQQTSIALAPFGMPMCTLLVDPGAGNFAAFGTTTDATGRAVIEFALPPRLTDMDVWFQWAHQAPAANAAGIALTEGLRVEVR